MSKKKNKQVTGSANAPVNNTQRTQQPIAAKKPIAIENNSFFKKYAEQLIVAGIALITYLFLSTGLNNQFTNWDDNGYLTNDPFIKDISSEGIRNIFSTANPVMGNYHPLTILSYAIEYSYKGLAPWIYHFDSLILHILTTISVYIFIKVLTRRTIAAAITALLFGIHPMHVESVAWAAGRKDVIYGLFYMLSCTSYLYYVRTTGGKKTGWYIGALVLFVCSLLAKPVAVTLPVVFFIIDYFEKRKPDLWLIVDKLPGFILSVIFGLLSIQEQRKFGAYDNLDVSFTHLERIALGGYALCTYLWKAIVPVGLCCFYPYPDKPNGYISGAYYIYPVIVLALIFFIVRFARKNRVIIFGSSFFIINIFLLLQFVPVGSAIVADRYSYIPYVGLFFMIGWYISEISTFFESKKEQYRRYLVFAAVGIYCIVLGIMSNERCKVWYDSVSLWRDEIEKHPESPNAYNNLGAIYSDMIPTSQTPEERKKNYDSSYYYLTSAINIKPDFINSIICLGILQRTHGDIDSAKKTLLVAQKIDNKNAQVYLELGVVYAIKHMYDSAGYCIRKTLSLKPVFPEAHCDYANYLDITGHIDSSLTEYGIAIQQNPDAYIPYLNRGRIYTRIGKYNDALKDFAKAIEVSPQIGETYFSRSHCYEKMGNKALAVQDVKNAVSNGYVLTQADQNYYQQLEK